MLFKLTETTDELHQILAVQRENHFKYISPQQKQKDGFVTVEHDFETLQLMHQQAPQVIAKDGDKLVGYALVMPKELSQLIPVLVPMFELFEQIDYNGSKLSDLNFYVMGQICVKDQYKRQGIAQRLYQKHKSAYANRFDYCVTEISSSNHGSMKAHSKVGFKTIHTFEDQTDEWNIVLWDWT